LQKRPITCKEVVVRHFRKKPVWRDKRGLYGEIRDAYVDRQKSRIRRKEVVVRYLRKTGIYLF